MTAIVGVVQNGEVWMGGDNLGANGYFNAWNLAEPKVFRTGPFLVGVAGSPRVKQLIEHKLNLRDDPRESDSRKFMVVSFVDELRNILNINGSKGTDSNIDRVSGYSQAMVAFRGRIFVVQDDFQICERSEGYDAIGCGGDFALGSLFETQGKKLQPKQRVERALQCAEKFSAGVRGPFTILKLEKA